jgi:hypothetical protein
MLERTTSRVMAADGPYGEFYDFYCVSPEYFGYHHVCQLKIPITISGVEPMTFRLAAQSLILLRHCVSL